MNQKEINKYINYINDNINDLKLNHRREVLQIITYNIPSNKIIEKGSGTQIKFSDIDYNTLYRIYNFMYNKLDQSE